MIKITKIASLLIITTLVIAIISITIWSKEFTFGAISLSSLPNSTTDLDELTPEATFILEDGQTLKYDTNRKVGKLITKASADFDESAEEIIIDGEKYYRNYVPDDIDINTLDPSSFYVTAMVKRYFEESSNDRELKALIDISQKAGGLFVDHPKYGFIDLGKQIMKDLGIREDQRSNESQDETDYYNKRFRHEYLLNQFSNKAITEKELIEFKLQCEEMGVLVHGLHLYYMNSDEQAMYDKVKDIVDIEIKYEYEGDIGYITVEEYAILKETFDKVTEEEQLKRRGSIASVISVPYEFAEEDMVIEDVNSPYLYYLIALYFDGKINDEEKDLLYQACDLFGLKIEEGKIFNQPSS